MKHKFVNRLEDILKHKFNNYSLLKLALAHRSIGSNNNERLEFLGDSIINFVIAEVVFEKFPNAQEGQLSRLRAQIISRSSLAELGKKLNLGDYVSLGVGELKSGGSYRDSIISNAVESIIGAIYLDSDMDTCKNCILQWFHSRLEKMSLSDGDIKDPKTKLQEYLQKKQLPLPTYNVDEILGDLHDQKFKVSCNVALIDKKISGTGMSRRKAEQNAANKALKELKHKHLKTAKHLKL